MSNQIALIQTSTVRSQGSLQSWKAPDPSEFSVQNSVYSPQPFPWQVTNSNFHALRLLKLHSAFQKFSFKFLVFFPGMSQNLTSIMRGKTGLELESSSLPRAIEVTASLEEGFCLFFEFANFLRANWLEESVQNSKDFPFQES